MCHRFCVSCPTGKYCSNSFPGKANRPNEACTECGQGNYCNQENMLAPLPCRTGFQCPGAVMALYASCPDGTYSNRDGLTECSSCPFGKFSKKELDTDPIVECTQCAKGKYQDAERQANCKSCSDSGLYQDELGQQRCKMCPAGYMNRTGIQQSTFNEKLEDACQMCAPGTYNPQAGSGVCLACPRNSYVSSAGQLSCVPCPNGKITLKEGVSSVSECFCPDGLFDPGTGQCNPCGKCVLNEYMVSPCNATSDIR